MEYKGIDVSTFQGDIDWEKVRDEGIEFAIIRAGFGAGTLDDKFERNASECNRIGLPIGLYWFSYAYTEDMAREEAKYCLEAAKKYKVEYPLFYDFEYASIKYANEQGVHVSRTLASDLVNTFCSEVESNKYFASFYSNYDLLSILFQPYLRKRYALWYAQYASAPEVKDSIIWQYSSMGEIGGISTYVDMDIAYEDLPAIIRKAGLNGLKDDECRCSR